MRARSGRSRRPLEVAFDARPPAHVFARQIQLRPPPSNASSQGVAWIDLEITNEPGLGSPGVLIDSRKQMHPVYFAEGAPGVAAGGSPTTLADETALRRMERHGVTLTSTNQVMAELAVSWSHDFGRTIQHIMYLMRPAGPAPKTQ